MERRCWVNFQCRGVLLVWMIVGQGPIALAVGAVGGCLDIFSLIYLFSFLFPSVWETARYRLKYCLKGPLNPKQPTNIQMGVPAHRIYFYWPISSKNVDFAITGQYQCSNSIPNLIFFFMNCTLL